jgi:hypothetical protein
VLARAGLPVPEGEILTQRAHEEFLQTSGFLRDIRVAREGASGGVGWGRAGGRK